MATIKQKVAVIDQALGSLQTSIELFDKYKKIVQHQHTAEEALLFESTRDSIIQRFEYCTDLFWKTLKIYLTDIEKITLDIASPRGIIRAAVVAKVITEHEGAGCANLIESRNQTSHIYHLETAEKIAHEIPEYYKLMRSIIDTISTEI